MNFKNRIFFTLIFCAFAVGLARAQFAYVDWSANDTVVPAYTHTYELGADYSAYDYEFKIEYAETAPLTESDRKRYRISDDMLKDDFSVDSYIGVSRKKGQLDVSVYPIAVKDGKAVKLLSFKPVLEKKMKTTVSGRTLMTAGDAVAGRYAEHSVLASGKWVKIRVADKGVYQLTKSRLAGLGFSDPSKVKVYGYGGEKLSETNIQDLTDDLKQVPTWRKDDGSLLFYAKGTVKWTRSGTRNFIHTQNPYSQYSYYFITDSGDDEPLSFVQETDYQAEVTITSAFYDYALYEKDGYSWMHSGRTFFEDYDYANGNSRKYQMNLPGITEGTASVTVSFSANAPSSSGGTTLSVSIDDSSLGTMSIGARGTYDNATVASRTFTWSEGLTENPTLTLTHNRSYGISGRLDYIRISYPRKLEITDNWLQFRTVNDGYTDFRISAAGSSTKVWRIPSQGDASEIPGTLEDGVYRVLTDVSLTDEFVAVNTDKTFPSPEIIGEIENQDLHSLSGINYVIIVPESGKLTAQANRLAELHKEKDGLNCLVVSADKIYNEFSSGTPDATAYRRFMKMLYDKASTEADMPRYLLLLGPCVWDNRMITSAMANASQEDYLLAYESDNSVSQTYSYILDDYFGFLDDGEGSSLKRDKLDVGIGRITASNSSSAKDVVDKIEAYISNDEAGAWKNTICILGDDGDDNLHMEDADTIANQTQGLYPDYNIRKIYWDTYSLEVSSSGKSYPDATKDIEQQMRDGALIMNYTGHGAAYSISHEKVLMVPDFKAFRSTRLPLWITASCDISPFDMNEENIGETALLNADGAAIALLTTTRTVFSSYNRKINKWFMRYVLGTDENGKRNSLGDALRLSKCSLVTSKSASMSDVTENKFHFVLLGDPALTLAAPTYKVVVDEFNGAEADGDATTVSAGSIVTVKGHIEDGNGNVVEDFNGTVSPSVFDNLEEITCRNNAGAEEPFVFYDRTNTLYSGADSVKNGRFTFSFPVSLDINYSYENGLLSLYAVNNDKTIEANGHYENFIVGGTSDDISNPDENEGPEIVLYLNSDSFVSGDKVNETPLLYASLSDKNGINTTGSGVGHDIVAIIDNNESMTYTLNSYYVPEVGDYTKGHVSFSIPELEEGKHTLLFRAWDIMNKSSVKEIEFYVEKGQKPTIFDFNCTSPIRESATFTIVNNRPQSLLNVAVDVYDTAGRKVWTVSESGSSDSNEYKFTWNLQSTGCDIQPGIYICRARISRCDGTEATKARKVIVLK